MTLRPEADTEDLIKKAQLKREQVEHLRQDIGKLEKMLKRIQTKLRRKGAQVELLQQEIFIIGEQLDHVGDDYYKIKDKKWKS